MTNTTTVRVHFIDGHTAIVPAKNIRHVGDEGAQSGVALVDGKEIRIYLRVEWGWTWEEQEALAGDDYYDEVRLRKEMEDAEQEDSPGYEELGDEEISRQEEYLRKAGYPIDTAINLGAPSVAQAEPQEPVLVPCPYCIPGTMHYKYQIDLCPNNPYRQR